jgi:hypothetical protein
MGTLAFFPWLTIEQSTDVGGYRLVQFVRGRIPGGVDQPIYDAVLAPYLEGEGRPIRTATILGRTGRGLSERLDEETIQDYFDLAELVAFAGLAGRKYFQPSHLHYANRDTYILVIQNFDDPTAGVILQTRRRDGPTLTYVVPSQYRVRQPASQDGVSSAPLESGLLAALLLARDHPEYPALAEAIFQFNRGNTDSDGVTEQAEVIYTVSAFERLLDCRRGSEDDLAERLNAAWRSGERLPLDQCGRIPSERARTTVTDTWIRDFFQHRGFHAHGRREARHPAVWSPAEHLLLGAYAFPLLVKSWLAGRTLYALTEDDQADIDVFEHLACADLFPPPDELGVPRSPWNKICGEFKWRRIFARQWNRAETQGPLNPPPDEAGRPESNV